MSSLGCKNFGLSSSLKEEAMVAKNQGIVSILGSDCERTKAASLRRTLSADMSSRKWQAQHGISPLKKIASSEELPVCITDSTSEGEEEYEERKGQFDMWNSIQDLKQKKEAEKQQGQFDIWSSIISQKAHEDSKPLPPPYIHPLVKRSASSLSEKSLEICTESLGSETGSDGFSSYPPSETGDVEEEQEPQHQESEQPQTNYDMEELPVIVNHRLCPGKKSPPRSFPPPLPSLARDDGASVHMRSRRDNGRLVLEAVSVPSQKNFLAARQDGRLVLTFHNTTPSFEQGTAKINEEMKEEEKDELEELEVEFEEFAGENESEVDEEEEEVEWVREDKDETEKAKKMDFMMMEQPPNMVSGGVINVHRLALMMNKPMLLAKRNPTWYNKFNEIVKFEEEEEEEEDVEVEVEVEAVDMKPAQLAQSLPPRSTVSRMIPSPAADAVAASTVATASSFNNAYEYYWRPKPMAAAQKQSGQLKNNSCKKLILSKNPISNEQQQLLIFKGNKGDYLVPLSNSCKEPRRSLLFWPPYCIATS